MLTGENWFPRRILDDWLERQRNTMVPPILTQNLPELTDRERQILWHIDMASTNAQIAFSLSISEHTVKTHIYNIFRKISVRNRTQASNWVKANLRKVEA
jgi:LuxR family transcriptional regulator of csgAB operon